MARSIRIAGRLVWLGILSGALAVPLWAQDVTVTVPPDDSSSQSQPAAQPDDPTAHPTDSAPSSNSAQAEAPAAPAASAPAATAEKPAAPPAAKKKHKTAKKAAPAPAAESTAAADPAAGAAPAATGTAKPAKKKTAKASCLNLAEDACGGNSACIWVAAGKDDAGKETKARCRSLAILKKEQEKAAKAAKTDKAEVLPWAPGGSPAQAKPATTASVETKPKKKTAAKKPKPKPAEAAAAAPPADSAPAAAPASGGDSGAAAPPADTSGASGAD